MLKSAFAVFEAASDDVGMATSLRALGRLDIASKQLHEAEEYLIRALDIETKLCNQLGLAQTWCALGQLTLAQGNSKDAQNFFMKSLEIFERVQSPYANRVRQELISL